MRKWPLYSKPVVKSVVPFINWLKLKLPAQRTLQVASSLLILHSVTIFGGRVCQSTHSLGLITDNLLMLNYKIVNFEIVSIYAILSNKN